MSMTIHADPVPLRVDDGGAIRVGPSRVILDLVIHAYQTGDAPETIVHKYPTLHLADVYAVISYYLRHRGEVDDFLRQREAEAAELQRKIEASQPPLPDLRSRWLARQAELEQGHVSPPRG
ncbi:MAG: DUF433 domain-containing protein [Planctomycetia bacterium]|nr:DUF433 domain-containing protein [Planctomycetia bacterium]